MYRPSLLTLALIFLAIAPATADQSLVKKELHQAKGDARILELVSWDCVWSGNVTVSVVGKVKNISANVLNNVGPYIEVLNQNGHLVGKSTNKPLDISQLSPNEFSTFGARITLDDAADVPATCELDFTDAHFVPIGWR